MTKSPDGGPAFPRAGLKLAGGVDPSTNGMTLRDWFAGQAMTGVLALQDADERSYENLAMHCYAFADAMLAAREKGE